MIVLSCLSDMKNKKRKVARYFRNTSSSQAYRLFIKTYALKVYRKSLVVVVTGLDVSVLTLGLRTTAPLS